MNERRIGGMTDEEFEEMLAESEREEKNICRFYGGMILLCLTTPLIAILIGFVAHAVK